MVSPLDLDQLQTFIAIVDSGSFTKAADRVFKTQSAVSMQMRRLEDTLRTGTPDDYADRYMPEIIGRFAKTHPNVELYIVCEPSVDLAERINRGELDIALVTHNPRERASDVVRTEPLCWVSSANHPLRDDAPVPLAVGRRDCH